MINMINMKIKDMKGIIGINIIIIILEEEDSKIIEEIIINLKEIMNIMEIIREIQEIGENSFSFILSLLYSSSYSLFSSKAGILLL